MRTYFAVFRILLLIVSFAATAAAQQPSPCANIESLKLPDESAKEVSEYARTVADSVSRNWNSASDTVLKKPWSALTQVTVLRDGQVDGAAIAQITGDRLTDQAALDTIRRASPFAALPTSIHVDCLAIFLRFSYTPGKDILVTTGGGVYRVGGGVSAPKVISSPDPGYTKEARRAKHEGICVLSLIVGSDGMPRDIRVARSLGMGLDEKAIEAVKKWRFDPAMKDGKPVAVAINVQMTFRLN
jgi:TonB family protein